MALHPEWDKIRLLERIDTEYAFLERTLEGLTPEQLTASGASGGGAWSIKDTLAHLTRWLNRLPDWWESARAGNKPAIPVIEPGYPWDQMDALNDANAADDAALPLEAVLTAFRSAHFMAVELAEACTEDDLFVTYNEALRGTWAQSIADCTCDHYHEHVVEWRRWLAGQATP